MSNDVLVVDDQSALTRVLEAAFRKTGTTLRVASSLAEGRAELRRKLPEAVLLDVGLPDGSGLELLADLQAEHSRLPVIVMTGSLDLALAARAMSGGAVDFLSKPFQLEEVVTAVGRAIGAAAALPGDGVDGPLPEERVQEPLLLGRHPSMIDVFKRVGLAATVQDPALIRGETGTGKEVVARMIHGLSTPDQPFVAVNCAALPDTLLETELFGHVKGAFTGAVASRRGRFEMAGTGTILLDEIGDTSMGFQAKILRVLEEREFSPVGSERVRPMRARVLTATHRDLEGMVERETFRSDLYYRIRVIELPLAPLRERREDIPLLARHFVAKAARAADKATPGIDEATMTALSALSWPGNIRELENVIRRGVLQCAGPWVSLDDMGLNLKATDDGASPEGALNSGEGGLDHRQPQDLSMDAAMRRHALDVLERCLGNKREASRIMGISPGRLYRILGSDLERPQLGTGEPV